MPIQMAMRGLNIEYKEQIMTIDELIKDEVEAVQGYKDTLKEIKDTESNEYKVLLEIMNEEIEHIEKLYELKSFK